MNEEKARQMKNREGEKGAALVMALLISFLLLVASAGILLESSLNTANVTDATADQQAYNAAESGIQSAINVLRGNVVPNPLLNPAKPAADKSNQINFSRALKFAYSNKPDDPSGYARLSRWLNGYDYTPSGAALADRVPIAKPYTPQTGYAFALNILDPDDTNLSISYTTSVYFYDADAASPNQKTYTSATGSAKIVYTPATYNNLNVSSGSANMDIGKFNLSVTGLGANVPAFNRFEITVAMTQPYIIKKIIRGYIESGDITPARVAAGMSKYIFDSQTFTTSGSVTTLNITSGANVYQLNPKPQRVGYEVPFKSGDNTLTGSVTPVEPKRLLIRSTGYGPRGATKQLEAIIQKDLFDGLSAPSTLTMVGPHSTPATTSQPATNFLFDPGSSNVTSYSGDDVVSSDIIPPIGTTNSENLDDVQASVDGRSSNPFNGDVVGAPSDVTPEVPDWLLNPLALDTRIKSLYGIALASGGYYGPGNSPTSGQFGNSVTATGITFVDHDVEFSGSGGGILVVTGKLTIKGDFSFNGLIIVTGAGGVDRSGGGGGTLQGNLVLAPYQYSKVVRTLATPTTDIVYDEPPPPGAITAATTFLAPNYNLSGGGNSTITYNSSSVGNGLTGVSNFALGVVEK